MKKQELDVLREVAEKAAKESGIFAPAQPRIIPMPQAVEIQIPTRTEGQIVSESLTIPSGATVPLTIRAGWAFWPKSWRAEGQGDLSMVYLRGVTFGAENIYPVHMRKTPFITRQGARDFEALYRKHHEEGITLEEAQREGRFGDRFMGPDAVAVIFSFQNKGKEAVTLRVLLDGLEVA